MTTQTISNLVDAYKTRINEAKTLSQLRDVLLELRDEADEGEAELVAYEAVTEAKMPTFGGLEPEKGHAGIWSWDEDEFLSPDDTEGWYTWSRNDQ